VKLLKTAFWLSLFCVSGVFFLCTIKNDNGNLAVTGPNTTNTTPIVQPAVPPVLIVSADSNYVGIKETLNITIKAMKDSSLSRPSINSPVLCYVNGGRLNKDTVFTDSNGRATVRFTDSVKAQITFTATCFLDTQKLSFQVTDAPDKIQQSIRIIPTKAILKADGKDNTAINVTIRNADNNPIGAGECVKFITTSGTIAGTNGSCNDPGKSATDAQGLAQAILTSENKNDTAYITAFLVSDKTKSAETKVVFQGVTIKLAADSTNLRVGGHSTIIATLFNASNEPIPYTPIYFLLGKDSLSNLSVVSKDTATGADGKAVVVLKSTKTGSDSIRFFAAGANSSTRITVTDLSLALALSDKVLQARESDSTFLHVLLLDKNNNGISKNIKITRYFQKSDGTDTSALDVVATDAQGKVDYTVYALPYEGTMRLEAVAFDNTGDLASAVTTVSFITTRTMTVYAIPTVIQADGTSKSQITVQIKNKQNNPIVGDDILFTSDAGMVTASGTTDENGKATAFLISDRRNTIATVTGTLAKDLTKFVTVQVEFSGVNLSATATPPTINSSGKDSSTIMLTLLDAAKNPIVGEKVNFYPRHTDFTHLSSVDTVTNNRGEASCKISGTGTGYDTISIKAAGANTSAIISYSSNYIVADTAFWQPCIANGNDSTQIRIRYFQGDKSTPIQNAAINVSVTVGSMSSLPVFVRQFTLVPADQGIIFFYMKNPNFATTATISIQAQTSQEMTSTTYQLYFKASKIKRIVLTGSPEVIAINNASTANRAKITGIAYDSLNNLVKGELVGFNMIHGPGGGEYLDPPVAKTGDDGSVTTFLVSGTMPSMFRDVWIVAGDLSAIKSDTVKFTIAGPPHAITIRTNLLEGIDYKDGTYGLPCAAVVTDVNGNPVADGTQITFSLKVSGYVNKQLTANFNWAGTSNWYWNVAIDTAYYVLPFEDFNDNFVCDPGEDRNADGVAGRGEDLDGDGQFITGPAYWDINRNGKRDYLPGDVVEPYKIYSVGQDSTGRTIFDTVFADYNGNGRLDTYEPLIGKDANMSDSEYTALLNTYKSQHHNMGYDFDSYPQNGIADPKTAVSVLRTGQTTSGKATNTILYGQSDAARVEVMVWAECQGIKTESPAQLVLPIIVSK
jgi:Bacterial Ig-like domain (group 1).